MEVLAYGGLRWGEIAALRRNRCELLRRRVHITESLADVNGQLIVQPTKTYERRYVTLPTRVVENLARHLEAVPPGGDTLVFSSGRGTPLRNQNFRRSYFDPAPPPGPGSRPGSRPTGCATPAPASWSIREPTRLRCSGTLGHRDVATTLWIYRHLFADRTNQLVDALDALYAEAETELSAAPVVRPLSRRRKA